MNRWHLLYHVHPLEELEISGLKHKIDLPKRMYMKGCLPKSSGTCRTRSEVFLVWLLDSSWRGHDNSGNTPSLHVGWSLLCCLSFETWLLPKEK
jgi:hypothetical protein